MIRYTNIRIYTSEKARHEGKPLSTAVLNYLHGLRVAARCAVFHGRAGLYESGEISSDSLADASYNLPLLLDLLVPAEEAPAVLENLKVMVHDGIVGVLPGEFLSFRSEKTLLPPHLLVRDIMTQQVQMAHSDFSVRTSLEIMLDHNLKNLPVVDAAGHVVGIVTTTDLLAASMPVRTGLFSLLPASEKEAFLAKAEQLQVASIMTKKPFVVDQSSKAAEAVHLMVRTRKKRLPVVDSQGKLVGMLARIDLLKAVSSESAARSTKGAATSGPIRTLRDIEKQDSLPISSEADLLSAVDCLVKWREDQAAVVDQEGKLVGLVSDRELFGVFARRSRSSQVVADVMRREVIRLDQAATIEEALGLMVENGLKRLPVVDEENRFIGMIRRDALLMALSYDL